MNKENMDREEIDKMLNEKVESGQKISPVLPKGVKNYLIDKDNTINIGDYLSVYSGNEEVFIHSKNWIFDNNKMLIGTSNLWDRSYIPGKDIELSILLQGKKINQVSETIITQYNENFKNSLKRNYIDNMIYYLDRSQVLEKIDLYQIRHPFIIYFKRIIKFLFIIMVLFLIFKKVKTKYLDNSSNS